MKTLNLLIVSAAVSGLALFFSQAAAAEDLQTAAIVPGADIVGTVAIRELQTSPLATAGTGAGTHALTREMAAKSARFEAATGLTKNDIISATFSCNIDSYDFRAATKRAKTANLSGLIAIKLAKPVTIGKIKQAIKLEYGTEELAGVADITISGHPALLIKSTKISDPDIFITVAPDKHLFMIALNSESLASALLRIKSGKMIKEPPPLARIRQQLPPKSQIKAASIIPPEVRAIITRQSKALYTRSKQDPRMIAAASITKLFQNLKSLSIGILLKNDALITFAGDMGQARDAKQAGILLQNMLIPMMQATMAQQSNSPVINLEKQTKVKVTGTDLFLQIQIPRRQIFSKRN